MQRSFKRRPIQMDAIENSRTRGRCSTSESATVQELTQGKVLSTRFKDLKTQTSGVSAHCHRVAALAVEIARAIPVPAEALGLVHQAALLHHASPLELNPEALHRLFKDVLAAADQTVQDCGFQPVSQDVTALVSAFHRFPAGAMSDASLDTLAQILFVGNLIDEQLELLAWEPISPFDVWESLAQLSGLFQPLVIKAAHQALRISEKEREAACLPLEMTAKELLQTLIHQRPDSVALIADLAGRDRGIAEHFLRAANLMNNESTGKTRSLRQAIVQIGTDAARKLLLVLSLRPIFLAAQIEGAWWHSLEMAEYFGVWACEKGLLAAEDALLLGLVHDVGTIAVQRMPEHTITTFRRLYEGGWAPQCSELLLLGSDHGELGASMLSSWGLPDYLTEAVRCHHSPADSDSVLASALYASGFWLEQDEDLPSLRHLHTALTRIGCSMTDLSKAQSADAVVSAIMATSAGAKPMGPLIGPQISETSSIPGQ